MRNFIAGGLALFLSLAVLTPVASAATQPNQQDVLVLKKKKLAETEMRRKAVLRAALERRRAIASRQQVRHESDCGGSFLRCLFGKPRNARGYSNGNRVAQSRRTSDYATAAMVSWSEEKYSPGSIIVKTPERALYLVMADGKARRYKVGVGREGFQWSGNSRIVSKQEWPTWRPPAQMIEREAAKGHFLPDVMEGGPNNPLGARAMYIGGTLFRIHGTNAADSIGGAVSSGCIRMMNTDVIDLYERVRVGAKVYVYQ